MKFFKYLAVSLLAAMAFTPRAHAQNADFQGVMLQGFYWDSYDDTKWTNLTSQADELSKYFRLIWVPNSARDSGGGGKSMGYTPVYWFSNYNTIFGNQAQLTTMINTFKEKGTGIIADVVVNHRCGVSNWTNFPAEIWKGTTYRLGPEHICCDDEVKDQAGQAKPTGAADTGEGYEGARDLDHTSATVQENIKAYEKFLLEDLGYYGFRYDYCKGFGAQYIKMYNQSSKPGFSVGEYWDGSYDVLANWIEGTGRTSAAFDFAFKYAVNNAFSSGNYSQLVWMANGSNPQPAGLIHYGYPQYAVTFIDNHDTARDSNKFTGDVVAANAFMLCSPGTPCVFLSHWKQYKEQLKPIIAARNAAGVTNTSTVNVFKAQSNVYLAEIIGSKGKVAVRIGSTSDVPSGYTSANIVASGDKYCVWSTLGKPDTNDGSINNGGGNTDTKLDLWLIGEDTDWSLKDNYKFTAKGNNTYVLSLDKLNGQFKIKDSDADWKGVNLGGDTGGEDVPTTPAVKGANTLWQGSSVNLSADNFGEVTLTLTYDGGESATLNISDGKTDTGDNNNNNNGDDNNNNNGGDNSNNDSSTGYTVYFDNSSTDWSSVYAYVWDAGDDNKTITNTWPGDQISTVTVNGKTYYKYSYASALKSPKIIFDNGNGGTGNQTADLDLVDKHVYTLAGMTDETINEGSNGGDNQGGNNNNNGGDVSGGLDLWIIGAATDWTLNDTYKFAYKGNDTYTLRLATFSGEFKIKDSDADWKGVNLGGDTGGEDVPTTPAVLGANTLWQGSSVNLVADSLTNALFTLTYDGGQSATLNIENNAGVQEIGLDAVNAQAEYYNLQGVKVTNPTRGLYIKRQGSTITKVIIR
jgi:hypothetical protein